VFLVSVVFLLPLPTQAQQPGPRCLPLPEMREHLAKAFKEYQVFYGLMGETSLLQVYAAEDGSTWTAVVVNAIPGSQILQACITAAGEMFTPSKPTRKETPADDM
jgi:hypothetical protein